MATQQLAAYNTVTLAAGEDLSAKQWRFVKLNTSGEVVLCGAGEQAIGVLCNKPTSGQAAEVQIGGIAKVEADAAVTAGDKLMSSADGQAATKTGTNNELGMARSAASAAATVIEVVLGASDGIAGGGVATVTSGAVNPGVSLSLLSVTGTVAYTLADGTIVGQEISIECSVAATSPAGTLTINDVYGSEPTTYVFNTVGQGIDLKWTATGWKLVGLRQMGIETVANAGTANPLCLIHGVAVADTVDFIQGSGLIAGQRAIWVALSNSGTPVGTVSGLFYTVAGAATGVDINFNAAGDNAVISWNGARWYPEVLTSSTIS